MTSLLGENYEGVLGSDFYAGYNAHLGWHQRWWVHFLRDIHDLKKRYPTHEELLTWSKDVKEIYDRAVAYAGPDQTLPPAKQEAARRVQQRAFEKELWAVCAPSAHTSAPMHTDVANGSSSSCRSYLSSWPSPASLPTIIWLNAVCARSSLHAKSAEGLGVLRAVRLAWLFSASSVLGSPKGSIPSLNVSPCSPCLLFRPFFTRVTLNRFKRGALLTNIYLYDKMFS